MYKILQRLVCLGLLVVLLAAWFAPAQESIGPGLQPQISLDNAGNIRIAYGSGDSIFCATSTDEGESFSKPVFVGKVNDMHLGMGRGPQIASSANYSVITAIDKFGSIHFFRLVHNTNKWQYEGVINDINGSAPEGLMGIAADTKDNFYAVWLDIRHNKTNNICFSTLHGKNTKWTKNKLIYISPDEHVCECCKPSIDVKEAKIAVMFRNWLGGSRDLYLITSDNSGASFGEAKKLGFGTWKLNGCPMDGGNVTIDHTGAIQTSWQREGVVYYCKPGETELQVSKGKTCSLAADKRRNTTPVITLQDEEKNVGIVGLNSRDKVIVGKGNFLKAIMVDKQQVLCVWEQEKHIRYKKVALPSA